MALPKIEKIVNEDRKISSTSFSQGMEVGQTLNVYNSVTLKDRHNITINLPQLNTIYGSMNDIGAEKNNGIDGFTAHSVEDNSIDNNFKELFKILSKRVDIELNLSDVSELASTISESLSEVLNKKESMFEKILNTSLLALGTVFLGKQAVPLIRAILPLTGGIAKLTSSIARFGGRKILGVFKNIPLLGKSITSGLSLFKGVFSLFSKGKFLLSLFTPAHIKMLLPIILAAITASSFAVKKIKDFLHGEVPKEYKKEENQYGNNMLKVSENDEQTYYAYKSGFLKDNNFLTMDDTKKLATMEYDQSIKRQKLKNSLEEGRRKRLEEDKTLISLNKRFDDISRELVRGGLSKEKEEELIKQKTIISQNIDQRKTTINNEEDEVYKKELLKLDNEHNRELMSSIRELSGNVDVNSLLEKHNLKDKDLYKKGTENIKREREFLDAGFTPVQFLEKPEDEDTRDYINRLIKESKKTGDKEEENKYKELLAFFSDYQIAMGTSNKNLQIDLKNKMQNLMNPELTQIVPGSNPLNTENPDNPKQQYDPKKSNNITRTQDATMNATGGIAQVINQVFNNYATNNVSSSTTGNGGGYRFVPIFSYDYVSGIGTIR